MRNIEKNKVKIRQALTERELTLVFIRHGSTDWSEALLKEGPQDLPLNDSGIQHTTQMAEIFSDKFRPITLYASTLKRARESATIYSKKLDIGLTEIKGIQERYFGDYRLLSDDEIAARTSPPDMETDEAFHKRVTTALLDIIERHPDSSPIVVVSHEKVFEFVSSFLLDKAEKLKFSEVAILTPTDKKFCMEKYTTDSLTHSLQKDKDEETTSRKRCKLKM